MKKKIVITGNTVIDSLLMVTDMMKTDHDLAIKVQSQLIKLGYDLKRLSENRRLVLITGHRRENFGDRFINICSAIKALAEKFPSVDFVYPMHLSPNVRKPIQKVFGVEKLLNMFFMEPLEYLPFIIND